MKILLIYWCIWAFWHDFPMMGWVTPRIFNIFRFSSEFPYLWVSITVCQSKFMMSWAIFHTRIQQPHRKDILRSSMKKRITSHPYSFFIETIFELHCRLGNIKFWSTNLKFSNWNLKISSSSRSWNIAQSNSKVGICVGNERLVGL